MTNSRDPLSAPAELTELDVAFDDDLYQRIARDADRHAGIHSPADPWRMETLFPHSHEKRKRPQFSDLLTPWIGTGPERASNEEIVACREFIAEHASDAILPPNAADVLAPDSGVAVADVRTAVDIALITSHLGSRKFNDVTHVLEVGGGYGRLAEAFLRVETLPVSYVLVDVVPASLYYAYMYLKSLFPNRAIGSYYVDGDRDSSAFECYVTPPWHFVESDEHRYDVAVNIASFQEMETDQVDYYLNLFDRALHVGGTIYLSNSRTYKYPREYRYPDHWQLLFKRTAPSSFSPSTPIEILRKSVSDCSTQNALVQESYRYREAYLQSERQKKKIEDAWARGESKLRDARRAATRLRDENGSLRSRLGSERERTLELKKTLAAQRKEHEQAVERLTGLLAGEREASERRNQENDELRKRVVSEREAVQELKKTLAAQRKEHEQAVERLTGLLAGEREASRRRAAQHAETVASLKRALGAQRNDAERIAES